MEIRILTVFKITRESYLAKFNIVILEKSSGLFLTGAWTDPFPDLFDAASQSPVQRDLSLNYTAGPTNAAIIPQRAVRCDLLASLEPIDEMLPA